MCKTLQRRFLRNFKIRFQVLYFLRQMIIDSIIFVKSHLNPLVLRLCHGFFNQKITAVGLIQIILYPSYVASQNPNSFAYARHLQIRYRKAFPMTKIKERNGWAICRSSKRFVQSQLNLPRAITQN